MNAIRRPPKSVAQVLDEGWELFHSGLATIFPLVLVAELMALLPFANPAGSIFTMDLSLLGEPGFWVRAAIFGGVQAFLYAIAVQRLAATSGMGKALRALPAVFVGYICYEIVVIVGLVLTFIMFLIGAFVIGPLAGLVLCILPLAPTAAASTAMALFIFPAVLEKRGPFASLNESTRLTKTSRVTWAKVSLVISVPAIALLIAAVVGDMPGIRHAIDMAIDLRRRAEEGLSLEQVLQILQSLKPVGTPDRYEPWSVAGILLGAPAWWYTLTVCYAQYRDLKAGEED